VGLKSMLWVCGTILPNFFQNFDLSWVQTLYQFLSNWITFCNGVWVRAEECARMEMNGPILCRIVYRVYR